VIDFKMHGENMKLGC